MTDGDKGLSQSVDDFFDIRALAAVLIGFTLTKWLEVLVEIFVGSVMITQAAIWPIILVFFVVVMANAGKKTNHELKREEFEERIQEILEDREQ